MNYDILFEHVKMFFLNIGYLLCCNNEWLVTSTKKKNTQNLDIS